MSKVNIGARRKEVQNDNTYRYKMDKIHTKIEGRGNGIKTVLCNVVDIAAAMRTDPRYVTKYLGIQFGAQSNWDAKRDVGIVNGAHQAQEMQEQLFGLIELFILCPQCELPELVHKVKKNAVGAKCYSCGWVGGIRSQHNIMKYIIKNPPSKSSKPKGAEKSKKERRAEREKKRMMKQKGGDDGKGARIAGESSGARSSDDDLGDLSRWHMDPNTNRKEAEREKEQKQDEKFRGNHSKVAPDTPVALMKFILARPNVRLIDIVSEFERIKIAHKLDNQEVKLGKVLVDAVFDFSTIETFTGSIKQNRMLLGWYASDQTRASILMSYMEDAIVSTNNWKQTSPIFECFYDEGIFDERFFISWFNQPPENSYVVKDPEDITALKENAQHFIDWAESIAPEAEDTADDEKINADLEKEEAI